MADRVTGDMLRQAMRQVPSPVTVVTAGVEGEGRGITIGSFTSVSLDPPLVSFNVQHKAGMHDIITPDVRLAVHLLASDQAHLSANFAVPDRTGKEQFAGVPHEVLPDGTPVIDDVLTIFFCQMTTQHDAGDHSIFVCRVEEVEERRAGEPLLYYKGSYRDVGSEVGSRRLSPVKRVSSDSS